MYFSSISKSSYQSSAFPERWLLKRIFIVSSWNSFLASFSTRFFLFVIEAISLIESFQVICWSTLERHESCEPSLLVYAQVQGWWGFWVLSVDWVVVAYVGMEESFPGNGLGGWSTRGLNRGDSISDGLFWDGDDDCKLMSSRSCWSKSALSQKIIWLILGWLERKIILTGIPFRMMKKTMKLSRSTRPWPD